MHPGPTEQPLRVERTSDDLSARLRRRVRGEPELAQVVGEVLPCVLPRVREDIALRCATEDELDERDATALVEGGCRAVVEGANMPCTPETVRRFASAGVLFAPGRAATAGGVAVSALETSQNAIHLRWARDEVERESFEIMSAIHRRCVHEGRGSDGRVDYVRGANVAAFRRAADAMVARGIV